MAHLTKNDVNEIWNQMGSNKSWSSLHQILQQHLNKGAGIDNNMVKALLEETEGMQNSNQSFPSSPDQLYNELNSKVDSLNIG